MVQLSIRCHPCVPVAAEELEQWLTRQVATLRADVPHGTVRLSRLTQPFAEPHGPIGWLLELELFEAESERVESRVVDALRDMRLLGLQLTVMAPVKSGGLTMGRSPRANEHYTPSPEPLAAAMLRPCTNREPSK